MNMKKYRAILLSAGLGTRLRPLTLSIPKCLVKVNNETLLGRWLRILNNEIESIIINKHYLHEKVEQFLETKNNLKVNIIQSFEKDLLGTAGTLLKNETFFQGYTGLLIHSDNYSDFNLRELLKHHEKRPASCLMTMLIFETKFPSQCGIVELDQNDVVKDFHEKKNNSPGNLANGAIYVFDYSLVEWIKENCYDAKDFSTEIIPKLLGKIYTYKTNSIFIDIGSYEGLKLANDLATNTNY